MCGRYVLSAPPQALAGRLGLDTVPDDPPRYNIAPTQRVSAVRLDEAGRPGWAWLRWGLVPSWAKDPAMGSRLINARGETVHDKPSFRTAFRRRRCLLPADGFYEWRKEKDHKQPYWIGLEDREIFAFAGLWEHWRDPQGSELETCTIITTQANERVAPLHDRMPVILAQEDWNDWLTGYDGNMERLRGLLRPFPAEPMRTYAVGRQVNNPRHDDKDCIEPV